MRYSRDSRSRTAAVWQDDLGSWLALSSDLRTLYHVTPQALPARALPACSCPGGRAGLACYHWRSARLLLGLPLEPPSAPPCLGCARPVVLGGRPLPIRDSAGFWHQPCYTAGHLPPPRSTPRPAARVADLYPE